MVSGDGRTLVPLSMYVSAAPALINAAISASNGCLEPVCEIFTMPSLAIVPTSNN